MAEVQTVEQEAASRLTTQEKLLLAQAVHKVGAANWPAISKLLVSHPCCKARPGELFTPEACEAEYVGLMQTIGQNVPAEGAKVHLRLAQTFYVARMEELKSTIAAIETRFTALVQEISDIKAGKLDAGMLAELRAVLERKYGKKLLDSWVPHPEDIAKAVEAGPPTEDELAKAAEPTPVAKSSPSTPIAKSSSSTPVAMPVPEEPPVEEEEARAEVDEEMSEAVVAEPEAQPESELEPEPEPEPEQEQEKEQEPGPEPTPEPEAQPEPEAEPEAEPEIATPVAVAAEEEEEEDEREKENEEDQEDQKESIQEPQESDQPEDFPAKEEAKDASPVPSVHSELTPEPSSPPLSAGPPVAAESEPGPSTRRGKRKASLPLQEPPKSKRTTRRGGNSPMPPPEVPSPVAEPEDEAASEPEAETGAEAVEADEEDERPRSSRRRTQRNSVARKESPAPSTTRTRNSSPAASRRTPSVMSRQSATPVPEEKPRRGRPPRNSRVMRDEIVSKSVREQTVESVKEEEEEERPTTRPTRKKAAAEETSAREEKKVRASTKMRRDHAEDDASATGDGELEEPDKDEGRTTRASASEQPAETPVPFSRRAPRGSLPKEQKNAQKMLISLLEQVNQHKSAPVFMNPVKRSDASDYYDIIKRPMDLKQVRTRIREGIITTIAECERDILLIFANAMMYNNEGTEVYEMAENMLKSVESTIAHFRSMQHEMSREGR